MPQFAGLSTELVHFYVTVPALPLVEGIHEHRRQVKVEIELFPQDAVELLRPLRLVYPTFSADTRLKIQNKHTKIFDSRQKIFESSTR